MAAFDEDSFDRGGAFDDQSFDFDSIPPVVTGDDFDGHARWRRIGYAVILAGGLQRLLAVVQLT